MGSPGAQPASYEMGTGCLAWGKMAGVMALTTRPTRVEVKERVELYIYSPSGLSWPVLG